MKIELRIRLYGIQSNNIRVMNTALKPDNLYNDSYETKIHCKVENAYLECRIYGSNVMKIKGLFNDLIVNINTILKALSLIE